MNHYKIPALTVALLGGLALAGCDNNVETAGLGTDEADATAMSEPLNDNENPAIDSTLGEEDVLDDPSTMGDANEPYGNDPLVEGDPGFDLDNDPAVDGLNDDTLDDEPVDGSESNL